MHFEINLHNLQHKRKHTHTHTHTHACMHSRTHTHTHTHTHTYNTHTHTQLTQAKNRLRLDALGGENAAQSASIARDLGSLWWPITGDWGCQGLHPGSLLAQRRWKIHGWHWQEAKDEETAMHHSESAAPPVRPHSTRSKSRRHELSLQNRTNYRLAKGTEMIESSSRAGDRDR